MKTNVYIDAGNLYYGLLRDSDFIAPLDLIRRKFGKQVLVFDPHERFSDICYHASYYAHIPRDLPAKCQLPDVIPVGTNGRTIHRPEAWV